MSMQPIQFRAVIFIAAAGFILAMPATAIEIEGFTEPLERVKVAAAEMGVLSQVLVQEGQAVKKGQTLATLRDEVLQVQLRVARQELESTGKLESAQAEVSLRTARLRKLQSLKSRGFAREEEVARARADHEIATARLKSAKEELLVRKLQLQKIQAQLNRRIVRAPIDGVVTVVKKHAGEFVAPNDPIILEVVQLKTIFARFSIAAADARQLQVGKPTTVLVGLAKKPVAGTIHFIAPVIEAESGTVRVKIRIDNSKGHFRSGEKATWSR